MAKFISIYYKDLTLCPPNVEEILTDLANRLIPDNFSPNPTQILKDESFYTAIINPTPIQRVHQQSACIGLMTYEPVDWHEPNGGIPDGNYAIIRSNKNEIELLTDASGTHTIWYYKDDNIFIASSSQRAIISLIGSYQPNYETFSWFLSGGFHGPHMSWDKRLTYVKSNHSSLILDRKNWTIEEQERPVDFPQIQNNESESISFYKEKLAEVFGGFNIDFSQWVLPLSGGYDSRSLLFLLKKTDQFRTVTWGDSASVKNPFSDPVIAENLAKKAGVSNQFFPINFADQDFETVFNRFLINGEGRIDTIAGYIDGFDIWKQFFEQNNIQGIIRGDLAFGQGAFPHTIEEVWHHIDQPVLSKRFPKKIGEMWGYDLPNLEKLNLKYLKKEEESLTEYRDRMYIQYRTPAYIGAQNELKAIYIEPFSPFLTRKSIEIFKSLPDQFKEDKRLIKEIVGGGFSTVPISSIDSNMSYKRYLREEVVTKYLINRIEEGLEFSFFPEEFLNFLIKYLHGKTPHKVVKNHGFLKIAKKRLKKIIPESLLKLRKKKEKEIDLHRIAFRVCIILEMQKILGRDKDFLKEYCKPLLRNI